MNDFIHKFANMTAKDEPIVRSSTRLLHFLLHLKTIFITNNFQTVIILYLEGGNLNRGISELFLTLPKQALLRKNVLNLTKLDGLWSSSTISSSSISSISVGFSIIAPGKFSKLA